MTLSNARGGEANTASNVGTGAGVFKTKTDQDLKLRSIKSSDADLSVTENADDITLGLDATDAATANTLMRRDASGRAKAVDPSAASDVTTKGYVDTLGSSLEAALALDETAATTYTDITGVAVTLNRAGRWLITGHADFQNGGNAGTNSIRLMVDGVAQTGEGFIGGAANTRVGCVSFNWVYTAASSGLVAKIQADTNVGAVTIKATNTKITAIYLGA